MSTKKPFRCGVYCRISFDPSNEGAGVERQERLCRKLAVERGWSVSEVFTDNDLSAFGGKRRAAYERMLLDVESGALDAIIAIDQDRLVRRVGEIDRLIRICENTDTLILLASGEIDTSTDDGILKAHLLAMIAENESRKKATRQRRQRQDAAEKGTPQTGHRAFGYRDDNVTVLADEGKIVREIFRRYLSGEALHSIARSLNERGVLTYTAKLGGESKWSARTLRSMLVNPRYCGLRTHRGVVVAEGSWRPLITVEEHQRAVAMLQRKTSKGRPVTHLLPGIVKCARCGRTMYTSAPKNAARRYLCTNRPEGGCGRTSINAEPLEALIVEAVLFRLDSSQFRRALTSKKKMTSKRDDTTDVSLAEIERQLETLAADFGNGTISRREWLAARTPLERRRDAALRALEVSTDRVSLAPFTGTDPSTVWASASTEQRRNVVRTLVDRIIIAPAKASGSTFDPDRISIEWKV